MLSSFFVSSRARRSRSLFRSFVVVVAMVAAMSCTGEQAPAGLQAEGEPEELRIASRGSVVIAPDSVVFETGDTLRLSAVVRDRRGRRLSSAVVSWRSSNAVIATVSSSGLVTGLGSGAVNVTATSGSVSDAVRVVVTTPVGVPPAPTPPTPPSQPTPADPPVAIPGTVSDLAMQSRTDSSLSLGFTAVGDGTGVGARYTVRVATPTLVWGSATDVSRGSCAAPIAAATIGTRIICEVRGLVAGTAYQAQVIAFRGTLNADAVFGSPSNILSTSTLTIPVATVTLSASSATLQVGQSTTLTATLRSAANVVLTGRSIVWSSATPSVASVNSTGVVTAVGPGTAVVSATSEGRSASATITVPNATGAPIIARLSRDAGSAAGGTVLFVDGSNFTPASTVSVGGSPAGVSVVSATRLRIVTPAGSVGVVPVVVTTASGSVTSASGFEYLPAPTTTYVSTDFEDGTLGAFKTTGDVTVSNWGAGYSVSGTRSARSRAAGGTSGHAELSYNYAAPLQPAQTTTGVYQRWYVRMDAATLAAVQSSGQIKLLLNRQRSGAAASWLHVGYGAEFPGSPKSRVKVLLDYNTELPPNGMHDTQFTPVADQWFEIQTHYRRYNGTARARMWINGKLVLDVIDPRFGTDATTDAMNWSFALDYTQNSQAVAFLTMYVDDARAANGFIEPSVTP